MTCVSQCILTIVKQRTPGELRERPRMLRILTIVATGLFCSIVGSLSLRARGRRCDGHARGPFPRDGPAVSGDVLPGLPCQGEAEGGNTWTSPVYSTVDDVAKDIARWDLVLEQLEAKSMPPARAKRHPTPEDHLAA